MNGSYREMVDGVLVNLVGPAVAYTTCSILSNAILE